MGSEMCIRDRASAQELSTAEDMGQYWRLRADLRGLNYKQYFSEGTEQDVALAEFNSHNAKQMRVNEIADLLLGLPEFTEHAFDR